METSFPSKAVARDSQRNRRPETAVRTGIPIIFIHQHYSYYLEFTLRQAVFTNPTSPVYLLGDAENNRFPFLTHRVIESLSSAEADRFRAVYQHDSPNTYDYELFCFIRWFLVKELMIREGYTQVFVADSDVMIFSNLTQYVAQSELDHCLAGFNVGADYQWVNSSSGHSSYWTLEGISRFCELAIGLYSDPRLMQEMARIRADKASKNDRAGISDMTALFVFYKEYETQIRNLSAWREGSAFDHNICLAGNYNLDEYEFKKGHKVARLQAGHPVSNNVLLKKLVSWHTLHFQGGSKNIVHRYYTGRGLLGERIFRELRYRVARLYRAVRKN